MALRVHVRIEDQCGIYKKRWEGERERGKIRTKKGERFESEERREFGDWDRGANGWVWGLWTPNAHEQPAPDPDPLGVYAANDTERDQSQSGEGRGEGVRTMLVARRGFVSVVHINQCKRPMHSCIVH